MGGIQDTIGGDSAVQQQLAAEMRIPWDCQGPPPNNPADPTERWTGHLSPSCDCGVHRHALRNLWIAVITAETKLRKRSEIFAVFTASAWVGFRTKVSCQHGPLGQLRRKVEEGVRYVLLSGATKPLLPPEARERLLVLHC